MKMIEYFTPIVQSFGYIIIGIFFIVMIKADVKILRVEMKGIRDNLNLLNGSFKQLSDILSQVAVQDVRIDRVVDDIRELKHGKGFIVDGEYTRKGKV